MDSHMMANIYLFTQSTKIYCIHRRVLHMDIISKVYLYGMRTIRYYMLYEYGEETFTFLA